MWMLAAFLIPLASALLSGLSCGRITGRIAVLGGVLTLLAAAGLVHQVAENGPRSLAIGAWPLPVAIELAADPLSAAMVLLIALLGLAVTLYAEPWAEPEDQAMRWPLLTGLIAASIAVCLAADLFNLYVWLELMLVTLLGLLLLGGDKAQREAAFKYFALNMLGTLLLLTAIGLIQGATGHLNLSALGQAARDPMLEGVLDRYVGLLLIALLLKTGAFPLFAWLPATYHTLPAPLLALVGGLLTKIAVYVLMRLTDVFDAAPFHEMLGWLAVATMVSGVLGAAYHWDLRRILAFHIVSQIGYLLLGLALASPAAGAATAFFLFHNALVKANLFLIAGLVFAVAGHYDLRRIGGIYSARPLLALMFSLSALSLVGVPPTTGFWGKFLLLQETFDQQRFVWGGVALATGLLTLYSMSKIWLEGICKPHPTGRAILKIPQTPLLVVIALTLAILLLGLYPEPVMKYLNQQTLWEAYE